MIAKIQPRLKKMLRNMVAEPYKHFLGYALVGALRINKFEFPPGEMPPPTPARKYIDDFLSLYEDKVSGRCVEFAPPLYSRKFIQNPSITHYEIWDTTPGEGITIVGDLQDASHIPDASFDTIICTHVLCCIPKPWLAIAELHRLLSPGGLILCTNPVTAGYYAPHPIDCWRFTHDSMGMLFSDFQKVDIHCFGNAATVAASPLFLMNYHFPSWILKIHDTRFPSIVAVAAWK